MDELERTGSCGESKEASVTSKQAKKTTTTLMKNPPRRRLLDAGHVLRLT